jgi:dihydrodipicolinate reductase
MEGKIKVGLWGFGVMNKAMLRYLKGYEVVAVIGRHDVGKDAGEVAGTGPLGVSITDPSHADEILKLSRPKVMLIATQDTLKEQE